MSLDFVHHSPGHVKDFLQSPGEAPVCPDLSLPSNPPMPWPLSTCLTCCTHTHSPGHYDPRPWVCCLSLTSAPRPPSLQCAFCSFIYFCKVSLGFLKGTIQIEVIIISVSTRIFPRGPSRWANTCFHLQSSAINNQPVFFITVSFKINETEG